VDPRHLTRNTKGSTHRLVCLLPDRQHSFNPQTHFSVICSALSPPKERPSGNRCLSNWPPRLDPRLCQHPRQFHLRRRSLTMLNRHRTRVHTQTHRLCSRRRVARLRSRYRASLSGPLRARLVMTGRVQMGRHLHKRSRLYNLYRRHLRFTAEKHGVIREWMIKWNMIMECTRMYEYGKQGRYFTVPRYLADIIRLH
jgi:hypothetical protein